MEVIEAIGTEEIGQAIVTKFDIRYLNAREMRVSITIGLDGSVKIEVD
jgi:hypothetical protein